MEKEYLYVGYYIDTENNFILKIGTTNDLKRRQSEHNRNYKRATAHTMPKDMFLTWILFTLIWTIFSYLVWSANQQNTKGWILSTILLAILFSTCFTYTDNTISSMTILNFLLYVFLVVVLYKGTKETLIIVILSIILALILSKIKIQIIFTKSACIYFNSVLL